MCPRRGNEPKPRCAGKHVKHSLSPVGIGVLVTSVRHVLFFLNVWPQDLPVEPGIFHLHLNTFNQARERVFFRQILLGTTCVRNGFLLECVVSFTMKYLRVTRDKLATTTEWPVKSRMIENDTQEGTPVCSIGLHRTTKKTIQESPALHFKRFSYTQDVCYVVWLDSPRFVFDSHHGARRHLAFSCLGKYVALP